MPEQQPLSTESTAFRAALDVIRAVEPRVADAIGQEVADQREMLKLIASENYASPATLLAMGNWFSDKYAEGTIGRRFYAGCRNVDTVESIAAEHARELFGARHAYVQPHSGIDANLVAFWSVLAQRVEVPALEKAGVRQINDLSDADWAVYEKLASQWQEPTRPTRRLLHELPADAGAEETLAAALAVLLECGLV